MRSIERVYQKISEKNPFWSSYVCFFMAIENRNFTPEIIARWFNKLVDKDDYSSADKKAILSFLYHATKPAEDDEK